MTSFNFLKCIQNRREPSFLVRRLLVTTILWWRVLKALHQAFGQCPQKRTYGLLVRWVRRDVDWRNTYTLHVDAMLGNVYKSQMTISYRFKFGKHLNDCILERIILFWETNIVYVVELESFEIPCLYCPVILHLLVTVCDRLVVYRMHARFVINGMCVGGIWR